MVDRRLRLQSGSSSEAATVERWTAARLVSTKVTTYTGLMRGVSSPEGSVRL